MAIVLCTTLSGCEKYVSGVIKSIQQDTVTISNEDQLYSFRKVRGADTLHIGQVVQFRTTVNRKKINSKKPH